MRENEIEKRYLIKPTWDLKKFMQANAPDVCYYHFSPEVQTSLLRVNKHSGESVFYLRRKEGTGLERIEDEETISEEIYNDLLPHFEYNVYTEAWWLKDENEVMTLKNVILPSTYDRILILEREFCEKGDAQYFNIMEDSELAKHYIKEAIDVTDASLDMRSIALQTSILSKWKES